MVTFAQAQERAERWVNGDVPAELRREVRVREFDLGFVVWAEPSAGAPSAAGPEPRSRLVIARDSGETTLWPGLPVGEVVRRYEEEYGAAPEAPAAAPSPPQRVDLEATSFLLTPPEWLQQAADQMGLPGRRGTDGGAPGTGAGPGTGVGASGAGAGLGGSGTGARDARSGAGDGAGAGGDVAPGGGAAGTAGAEGDSGAGETAGPGPGSRSGSRAGAGASGGGSAWDAADTSSTGGGASQLPPQTVFAPPLPDREGPSSSPDARTELIPGRPAEARTTVAPAVDGPEQQDGTGQPHGTPPPPPNAPPPPPGPGAGGTGGGGGGVHHAATMLADPSQGGFPGAPGGPGAPGAPAAPGAPGTPGAPPPPPGAPGTPGSGSGAGSASGSGSGSGGKGRPPGTPPPPPNAPPAPPRSGSGGDVHHAATMLADPSQGGLPAAPGVPGTPGAPGAPGAPAAPGTPGTPPPPPNSPPSRPGSGSGGDVHHAATMLAGPAQGGPGAPPPPGPPPGAPGTPPSGGPPPGYGFPQHGPPGVPAPPPVPAAPAPPPGYGYPQQHQPPPPTGLPTVGPGYMAVLRYRAPDGSEQQLIRRSAPGTPHPEWQILHELRNMNVPPQEVLELHTELESCELPGGYCARMIRETWPQVRVTHTAPYGRDHASRQQGMRHLLEHQGELHQVADGPARPAPCRVPLPPQHTIPPVPPLPPDGVGHELMQAFGPQSVFRFDQHAVSRQGVPDIVGQTLVFAGLPLEIGPFFWAQAQPGRPIPTLAELAQERGVQPGPDAGSYLVVGNDFGKQLCVQYGTAHIVALPLEGGPQGQPAQPQFVSTGLPEFVRSLALLGRMWPLRYGLTQEQAGRWTVDFQAQLAALDPAACASPENWWAVLLEQMWDGLF